MDYQPEDIPEYLVKQIERALRAGMRAHEDVEWLRRTIGGGITHDALGDAVIRQRKMSAKRLEAALRELRARVDDDLILLLDEAAR